MKIFQSEKSLNLTPQYFKLSLWHHGTAKIADFCPQADFFCFLPGPILIQKNEEMTIIK
jgi:hypothetical protein